MTTPDNCPEGQLPFTRPPVKKPADICLPGRPNSPDTFVPPARPTDAAPIFPSSPILQVGNAAVELVCGVEKPGSTGDNQAVAAGALTSSVALRSVVQINDSQLAWLAGHAGALTALEIAASEEDVQTAAPVLLAHQVTHLLSLIATAREQATEAAEAAASSLLECAWGNDAQEASCAVGASGDHGVSVYTVGANTISSSVSKADANAKALALANAALQCIWVNTEQGANCVGDVFPEGYEAVPNDAGVLPLIGRKRVGTFTVAAGTVQSQVSEADANDRARQAAIAALSCFYVNPTAGSVPCANGAPTTTPGNVLTATPGNPVSYPALWVTSEESSAAATAAAIEAAQVLLNCVWTNAETTLPCPNADPDGDNVPANALLSRAATVAAGVVISTVSEEDMQEQLADLLASLLVCIYCNLEMPAKCAVPESGQVSVDATQAVPAGRFCDPDYAAAKSLAQAANSIPVRQIEAGGGEVGCRFTNQRVVASCNALVGPPVTGTLYLGPGTDGAYLEDVVSPRSKMLATVEAGSVLAESQDDADQVAKATALAMLDCFYENVRVEALCGDTIEQYDTVMGNSIGTITGSGAGMLDGVALVHERSVGHPCRPAIVLAGSYRAFSSQDEANLTAVTAAISLLNCFYMNQDVEEFSDCGTDDRGIPLILIKGGSVMPNTVRSEVSQADADEQAAERAQALTFCIGEDLIGSGETGAPGERGPAGNCSTACAAVYS